MACLPACLPTYPRPQGGQDLCDGICPDTAFTEATQEDKVGDLPMQPLLSGPLSLTGREGSEAGQQHNDCTPDELLLRVLEAQHRLHHLLVPAIVEMEKNGKLSRGVASCSCEGGKEGTG